MSTEHNAVVAGCADTSERQGMVAAQAAPLGTAVGMQPEAVQLTGPRIHLAASPETSTLDFQSSLHSVAIGHAQPLGPSLLMSSIKVNPHQICELPSLPVQPLNVYLNHTLQQEMEHVAICK